MAAAAADSENSIAWGPLKMGRQIADKKYFCHQCKQDLLEVRSDLTCPLCSGDFLEESESVERPEVQEKAALWSKKAAEDTKAEQLAKIDLAKLGAVPKNNNYKKTLIVCQKEKESYQNDQSYLVKRTTNKTVNDFHSEAVGEVHGQDINFVPPPHLYQAFLKEEDKFKGLVDHNPYLYLEDEDRVDNNFPNLADPSPSNKDERIAEKEAERKLLSTHKSDTCPPLQNEEQEHVWSSENQAAPNGNANRSLTGKEEVE